MKTVITDFSDVYYDFARLTGSEVMDCSRIGGTNCYCDDDAQIILKKKLSPYLPDVGDSERAGMHWLDSGDYHYLTKIWTDEIRSPFSLVLFDHHPDMQDSGFGDILSCGNWVKKVLETNVSVRNVVMIGVKDELRSLATGEGLFFWGEEEVCRCSPFQLLEKTSSLNLCDNVYFSIDKDVLSMEHAATNWDQGRMSLLQLEIISDAIFKGRNVLGVDICGEMPESKGGTPGDFATNLRTDLELQHFFRKRLG